MQYVWEFDAVWDHRLALLNGLFVTLELSFISIVTGLLLGTSLALAMSSTKPFLQYTVAVGVSIVRGVPLLVSLLFGYYLLPILTGVRLSPFTVSWTVLSLNFAAFASDVLRCSIRAVPREYVEAGMALGMTRWSVFSRVVVPETVRRSLPALTALAISLIRYSSLVSVVSVTELTRAADLVIVEKYKPLELYSAVAFLYLCIILPISYAARRLELNPWFGHQVGINP